MQDIPLDCRVGVLGKGKTGGEVIRLLAGRQIVVFDRTHPPQEALIKKLDVLFVFIPGPALLPYLDLLSRSGICVICGSTGMDYPHNFSQVLQQCKTTWIQGNNFSLALNILKKAIYTIGQLAQIDEACQFAIHEIHHIHKKDAPSGTALLWKRWLEENRPSFPEVQMTSERRGEEIGTHHLTVTTPFEQIQLTHKATDRKLFAQGALWAVGRARQLAPGFYQFSQLLENL